MSVGPARSRLPADDRRRQLVEIGVGLLSTRPIHELALDEVAAEAGISRSLLFHYFPTKSDYYVAVVRSAAERLLRPPREPAAATPQGRVRAMVVGYLRLVSRSRDAYVALVRGAAGADPRVLAVLDELRDALVRRWLVATEQPDSSALTRLLLRGWLAGLEEVALAWDPDEVDLDTLADALVRSFDARFPALPAPA